MIDDGRHPVQSWEASLEKRERTYIDDGDFSESEQAWVGESNKKESSLYACVNNKLAAKAPAELHFFPRIAFVGDR